LQKLTQVYWRVAARVRAAGDDESSCRCRRRILPAQLLSLICQLVPSFGQHQLHHSAAPEVIWHRKASPHTVGCELPIIIWVGRRLLGLRLGTHDTAPRFGNDELDFENLLRLVQSILLLGMTKNIRVKNVKNAKSFQFKGHRAKQRCERQARGRTMRAEQGPFAVRKGASVASWHDSDLPAFSQHVRYRGQLGHQLTF
jgi:hypothetical protein